MRAMVVLGSLRASEHAAFVKKASWRLLERAETFQLSSLICHHNRPKGRRGRLNGLTVYQGGATAVAAPLLAFRLENILT